MSKIEITTVTFVNGTPLDDLSSESVERLLAKTQARIDDITDRARSGAATNTMLAERDSLVTAQRALIELINRRDARPTLEERVAKLEEARS